MVCISFHTECNIKAFMNAYREENRRVTPKIHMLGDHMVTWIRQWGVGAGFHSKQGASIPILSLQRVFASTRDSSRRLQRVMNEHYLKNSLTELGYLSREVEGKITPLN